MRFTVIPLDIARDYARAQFIDKRPLNRNCVFIVVGHPIG
jgi:hypothetical protein